MMTYRVKVKEFEKGKYITTNIILCDVQGKDLDEEIIVKRLTNNIKTWQSAYNKGRIQGKRIFEIDCYERVK